MDAFAIERQTLESHQLERRFATLRLPEPKRLAALERSLALAGQLQPLIAVPAEGPTSTSAPFVLLDGYRRLEVLGGLPAIRRRWRSRIARSPTPCPDCSLTLKRAPGPR